MNDLIKRNVHHFSESDDVLIKAKLLELEVSEGWETLPNGYIGASILCYRGNDIWLFRYNPNWEEGHQYDMIVFKNFKKYSEVEDFAWSQIYATKGIERLPLEININ